MRNARPSPELAELPRPARALDRDLRSTRSGTRLDTIGVLLLAMAVLWTYWAASASGGRPHPPAVLLLTCGAAFLGARVAGAGRRWLVPVAVVAAAAWIAIRSQALLSAGQLDRPFGYANATGAFFVQVAVAASMIVAAARASGARVVAAIAAIAAGTVPFVIRSLAAALAVLTIPVALLSAGGSRATRAAIGVSAALFVGTLSVTLLLAATYRQHDRSSPIDVAVAAGLTQRRVVLWSEALAIMRDRPTAGVGPGQFYLASPTARADRDARWAHHGFLQFGAETGLPGFILLVLLFLWGFARLWATPDADGVTALGAVALAALGIHASVDYVLHFPVIPITVSALVGTATAGRRERG